jgi:altronate dehydratase
MTATDALRLHTADTVAVALRDLAPGAPVRWRGGRSYGDVSLKEAVPLGHKISLRAIAKGQPVLKYGVAIGVASASIPAGAHVHVHNLASARVRQPVREGGA